LQVSYKKSLGREIEARGRFVQNQDGGSLKQCPGEGEALPLAARELARSRADPLIDTLRESCGES